MAKKDTLTNYEIDWVCRLLEQCATPDAIHSIEEYQIVIAKLQKQKK